MEGVTRRGRWILGLLLATYPGCASRPVAPFIVSSPISPVERAYACGNGGWAGRLAALPALGPDRVVDVAIGGTPLDYGKGGLSPWTTDSWVFGAVGERPAVLEMQGDPELSAWGKTHFPGQHLLRLSVGSPRARPEAKFDRGGNVLVSPPTHGRFPHGRIIVGRDMDPAFKRFFAAQRVQTGPGGELIEVDTSWLKVGHVDEIVAFVPAPQGRPFILLLPDPEKGFELLSTVPPDRVLFSPAETAEAVGRVGSAGARYLEDDTGPFQEKTWKYVRIVSGKGAGQVGLIRKREGKRIWVERVWDLRGESAAVALRRSREGRCETMPIWFDPPDPTSRYVVATQSQMWLDGTGEAFPAMVTAGELRSDETLRRSATLCARRIYGEGGLRSAITEALRIPPEATASLPVVYTANPDGEDAFNLIPNPMNLVNIDGGVILLSPCGPRRRPGDDESDIFLCAWREAFKALGVRPHFLEGWEALHRFDGGARCGTNIRRRPR